MFTILIAVTSAVLAQAPHQQAIELLQDPRFANGVRVATRSHYPPAMQAETRERWRKALPATTRAAWEFIEIAELQNLSENPATPEVHGTRFTYASRDRSKRLEVDAENGKTHSSPAPWLGLEPAGHAVYWTPNLQGLELGRRTAVNIDAAVLAREAIAKMNTHYRSDLSPDDYLITEVLIGWEIWGPFRCDIHLRDLSFEAGN